MLTDPVRAISIAAIVWSLQGSAALATVTVWFEPALAEVELGSTVEVSIFAEMPDPIVAWGLDVLITNDAVLDPAAEPSIGPAWIPASTDDGDGLGGIAFPDSVIGDSVLLASLTLLATSMGETDLLLEITAEDPTEGFGLDPIGLADTSFSIGTVSVIPEPMTFWLLVIGGFIYRRAARSEFRYRSYRMNASHTTLRPAEAAALNT